MSDATTQQLLPLTDHAPVNPAEWNPYYLAYARAHGRHPEAQLAADRERWPGGRMCGFILWSGEQRRAFIAKHGPLARGEFMTPDERETFAAWLSARHGGP